MVLMNNDTPPPRKTRKKPRKATPRSLENAALHHLERFATSAENLRRVLMRRVEKSARTHGTDRDEGSKAVDDIIARFVRSGLLDDAAYARGRVASLRRRGDSARAIVMKLRAKGVSADIIDAALVRHGRDEEDAPDAELAAAARLAKRRRLGPYRVRGDRAERRERDLAALARAGFSYDIAKRVIDAATEEEIDRDD